MSRETQHPVVVGIDGSEASERALSYAAWEANRRGVPLNLIYGHQPSPTYGPGMVYAYADTDIRGWAEELLDVTAIRIREQFPELVLVRHKLIVGSPAGALIDQSRGATMVVVGSRGRGGFGGHLLGSVSSQVAAHSTAPVVVVRPPAYPNGPVDRGPILVGVDGSDGSRDALEFGFEQASARDVPLFAVYVWGVLPTNNLGPISKDFFEYDQAQGEAERLLAEAMAGWRDKYPDVEVDALATHSFNPVRTLADLGSHAGLIVVGPRGHGGFGALLLGSTADGLIRYADRSVAIVHRPA
jgi:nucleotide-binding universal stress UspA family protein